MKLVNIRSFVRGGYRTLTEQVTLIAGTEVLGTWTPVGWVDELERMRRQDERARQIATLGRMQAQILSPEAARAADKSQFVVKPKPVVKIPSLWPLFRRR